MERSIVTEHLDQFPDEQGDGDNRVLSIRRDEVLLFEHPTLKGIKLLEHTPLEVVHFPLEFSPQQFSPPRGVYESDFLRVEWQQMNSFRQPFYHRNADVDELSYQVCGERTLMTEYGTVELRPGDFSRIPVRVAHDNFGRQGIHLLFYIPAPVRECVKVNRTAGPKIPPFDGWQAATVTEVMTNCLGGPHCDIAAAKADENLLLKHAETIRDDEYIRVLRSDGTDENGVTAAPGQSVLVAGHSSPGPLWLYKSADVWIGSTRTKPKAEDHVKNGNGAGAGNEDGIVYRRHSRVEEIQCQITGSRTLITQRGIVQLHPGDFVNIPVGVAFTDHVDGDAASNGESHHISILTRHPCPPKAQVVRQASPATWDAVMEIRNGRKDV
ncbi:hypothetical protein HRR83_004402 [Exophiala dermatitidis]|uniref:Homogentisate 1,2-dioxygenase n=2 Tax=Exophiala dermatitidis TaxID=5970 RepID=H6BQ31_EXODN